MTPDVVRGEVGVVGVGREVVVFEDVVLGIEEGEGPEEGPTQPWK